MALLVEHVLERGVSWVLLGQREPPCEPPLHSASSAVQARVFLGHRAVVRGQPGQGSEVPSLARGQQGWDMSERSHVAKCSSS